MAAPTHHFPAQDGSGDRSGQGDPRTHYQGGYGRGGSGEGEVQVLAQTMYPPLPGQRPHSSVMVGHPGLATDLALAGYQHIHASDPGLASRLNSDPAHLPDIVHSHSVGLPPSRPNQHRSGTAAAASRHQRQRQQQARGGPRTRIAANTR